MSFDKQHVMGAAAEASEPALVSDQAPAGLAPTGFDQAPVTQEDRDAAAALVRWQRNATSDWAAQNGEEAWQFFVNGFSRGIVQGIWDEHPVVQAFAKHRLAALEASSRQEERLREVAWLVEFPESGDSYHGGKRVGPATPVQWYCGLLVRADQVCTRTANPKEAIRFARKCDAEAVILLLENESQWKGHGRIGAFPSEHVWIAALEPPHAKDAADV